MYPFQTQLIPGGLHVCNPAKSSSWKRPVASWPRAGKAAVSAPFAGMISAGLADDCTRTSAPFGGEESFRFIVSRSENPFVGPNPLSFGEGIRDSGSKRIGVKTEWLGELMGETPEDLRDGLRKRPELTRAKKTARPGLNRKSQRAQEKTSQAHV